MAAMTAVPAQEEQLPYPVVQDAAAVPPGEAGAAVNQN
jgi:hypothetical protein